MCAIKSVRIHKGVHIYIDMCMCILEKQHIYSPIHMISLQLLNIMSFGL